MQRSFLPPLDGEGGRREAAIGWGGLEVKGAAPGSPQRPHPASPDGSATLPMKGREKGLVVIEGYASLWGAADLNGDVVAKGAFADSLART